MENKMSPSTYSSAFPPPYNAPAYPPRQRPCSFFTRFFNSNKSHPKPQQQPSSINTTAIAKWVDSVPTECTPAEPPTAAPDVKIPRRKPCPSSPSAPPHAEAYPPIRRKPVPIYRPGEVNRNLRRSPPAAGSVSSLPKQSSPAQLSERHDTLNSAYIQVNSIGNNGSHYRGLDCIRPDAEKSGSSLASTLVAGTSQIYEEKEVVFVPDDTPIVLGMDPLHKALLEVQKERDELQAKVRKLNSTIHLLTILPNIQTTHLPETEDAFFISSFNDIENDIESFVKLHFHPDFTKGAPVAAIQEFEKVQERRILGINMMDKDTYLAVLMMFISNYVLRNGFEQGHVGFPDSLYGYLYVPDVGITTRLDLRAKRLRSLLRSPNAKACVDREVENMAVDWIAKPLEHALGRYGSTLYPKDMRIRQLSDIGRKVANVYLESCMLSKSEISIDWNFPTTPNPDTENLCLFPGVRRKTYNRIEDTDVVIRPPSMFDVPLVSPSRLPLQKLPLYPEEPPADDPDFSDGKYSGRTVRGIFMHFNHCTTDRRMDIDIDSDSEATLTEHERTPNIDTTRTTQTYSTFDTSNDPPFRPNEVDWLAEAAEIKWMLNDGESSSSKSDDESEEESEDSVLGDEDTDEGGEDEDNAGEGKTNVEVEEGSDKDEQDEQKSSQDRERSPSRIIA